MLKWGLHEHVNMLGRQRRAGHIPLHFFWHSWWEGLFLDRNLQRGCSGPFGGNMQCCDMQRRHDAAPGYGVMLLHSANYFAVAEPNFIPNARSDSANVAANNAPHEDANGWADAG